MSGFRGGGVSLRVVRESADSVELSVESDRVGVLQREDFDGGVSTSAFSPGMHVTVAREAAVRFTVR